MRVKRTEWRMRGIEPNNKCNVVFPSSVLPSRCYGNPPSPSGEGLTGHIHVVISSAGDGLFRACAAVNKDISIIKTKRTPIPPCHCEERRGGVKHRKNSPQVTVFSQSGEVAMLRAGQASATRQSPGREMSEANPRLTACPWRLTALKPSPLGEGGTIASVSEPSDE